MSWVRYDDGFYSHPKVIAARSRDVASVALHVLANTWSATTKRPGFVPAEAPEFLIGSKQRGRRLAQILATVGLWDVVDGGWEFHDWEDYAAPARDRESASVPSDISEKRRNAGRAGGQKAAEARRLAREAAVANEANSVANPVANEASADSNCSSPVPDPEEFASSSSEQSAHEGEQANTSNSTASATDAADQLLPLLAAVPDPAPPQPQAKRTPRRGRTQGTRIPDDWQISSRLVAWTRTKGIPDHIGQREAEKFKDWWLQSTKPDAEKNDWDAAYRTWINRYLDKQAEAAATGARPAPSKRNPAG